MSEVKRYDGFLNSNMQLEFTEFEDGRYVKYSDVEKALKLWEIMRPIGLYCGTCQHVPEDNRDYCGLFDNYGKGRCKQCIDIFGGE